MGEAKRKRKLGLVSGGGGDGPAVQLGARVKIGEFPMTPGFDGSKRRIRVEFPAQLTTQEKYDVATALAKVAQSLVAEADAANAALQKARDE